MHFLLDLIRAHSALVLFGAAFLENLGVPIPSLVFMVLAGCLVIGGPVSLPLSFIAASIGALCGDLHWYLIGRWKGRGTLHYFCRFSLNPDSCVGRTERVFRTRAGVTVLTSKLLPGLNTIVPPLAGVLRMSLWRYLLFDAAGVALWVSLGMGLGLAFGAGILPKLQSIQFALLMVVVTLVAAYVVWRLFYGRYLVRHYSVPRVDSAELYEKLSSGSEVMVVDLRSEDAFLRSNMALPGSLRIPPAELDNQTHLLPKEKEIVLYCT
jgi:membrane protein DedA with SNARE-associated domain